MKLHDIMIPLGKHTFDVNVYDIKGSLCKIKVEATCCSVNDTMDHKAKLSVINCYGHKIHNSYGVKLLTEDVPYVSIGDRYFAIENRAFWHNS